METQSQQYQSQFRCIGCDTVLAFPVGAPSVRCPICENVTPISNIRVQCSTCSSCLVVPQNTTVAMCPMCNSVMSVARPLMAPQHAGFQQHQQQQQPQQQQQLHHHHHHHHHHQHTTAKSGAIPKNPAIAAALGKHNVD
eukprot:gene5754-8810_t